MPNQPATTRASQAAISVKHSTGEDGRFKETAQVQVRPKKRAKKDGPETEQQSESQTKLVCEVIGTVPRLLSEMIEEGASDDVDVREKVWESVKSVRELFACGNFDKNASTVRRGVAAETDGGLSLKSLIAIEHTFVGSCHLKRLEPAKTSTEKHALVSVCSLKGIWGAGAEDVQVKGVEHVIVVRDAKTGMAIAEKCIARYLEDAEKHVTSGLRGTEYARTQANQAKSTSRRLKVPEAMLATVVSMQNFVLEGTFKTKRGAMPPKLRAKLSDQSLGSNQAPSRIGKAEVVEAWRKASERFQKAEKRSMIICARRKLLQEKLVEAAKDVEEADVLAKEAVQAASEAKVDLCTAKKNMHQFADASLDEARIALKAAEALKKFVDEEAENRK